MEKQRGMDRLEALNGFEGLAPLAACAAGLLAAREKRGGLLRRINDADAPDTAQNIKALQMRLADLADKLEDQQDSYMRAVRMPGFIAPQRNARDARIVEAADGLCALWLLAAEVCADSVVLLDERFDPDRYDAAAVATGRALCAGAGTGCRCAAGEYIGRLAVADRVAYRAQLQMPETEGAAVRWLAQQCAGAGEDK